VFDIENTLGLKIRKTKEEDEDEAVACYKKNEIK
jgi:hypothetical protein